MLSMSKPLWVVFSWMRLASHFSGQLPSDCNAVQNKKNSCMRLLTFLYSIVGEQTVSVSGVTPNQFQIELDTKRQKMKILDKDEWIQIAGKHTREHTMRHVIRVAYNRQAARRTALMAVNAEALLHHNWKVYSAKALRIQALMVDLDSGGVHWKRILVTLTGRSVTTFIDKEILHAEGEGWYRWWGRIFYDRANNNCPDYPSLRVAAIRPKNERWNTSASY